MTTERKQILFMVGALAAILTIIIAPLKIGKGV